LDRERLRQLYGAHIERAASRHGVPEDLLTVVVFNEMMDYSWYEWGLERFFGVGNSLGPGQLTEKALRAHGIYPDSMLVNGVPRVGRSPYIQSDDDAAVAVRRRNEWDSKFRAGLNDPATNIDLLAQLINAYVGTLKGATKTTDGSWGLSPRVVSQILGLPMSNEAADKFRAELNRSNRPKSKVSMALMAVIQAMTNDTETVLTDGGVNDNVRQHVWNAEGLHPYIDEGKHKR
jgi:hypothetical protein